MERQRCCVSLQEAEKKARKVGVQGYQLFYIWLFTACFGSWLNHFKGCLGGAFIVATKEMKVSGGCDGECGRWAKANSEKRV